MQISELIILLEELKVRFSDSEIQALHHEGGGSLRAYPKDIDRDSFVDNEGTLTIGGYYK